MSVLSQGPFSHNRFNDYEKLTEKNSKPDYLDFDGDGNKKEPMKKALKEKGKKDVKEGKDCDCDEKKDDKKSKKENFLDMIKKSKTKKESFEPVQEGSCGSKGKKKVVKEDVLEYILDNNLANNPVSAEALFNHISDEFLEEIEDQIMEGYKPLPVAKMANQANKAYGKEQSAVKSGDEAGANKQMQRRVAMNNPAGRRQQLVK